MKQTPQGLLPIGTKLQFGDWDYGWITEAEVVGHTPKGMFYKIRLTNALKADGSPDNSIHNQSVKEVHQSYKNSYKGHCPIKIL